MAKVVIIEDELQAKNALEAILDELGINISGYAQSVDQAYLLINELKPDLIFLDIELINGTAFDLLDKFETISFDIIFVTGHDEFAVKAFRYNAIDYLLKPVVFSQLKEAIFKMEKLRNPKNIDVQVKHLLDSMKKKSFERILLHTQEGISIIPKQNIVRLESDGNYTIIFTNTGQKHLSSNNLKYYEDILPEPLFFRVHQSHIVNIDFIIKILKEDGGYVVIDNNKKIPIARRRKDEFLELLKSSFS